MEWKPNNKQALALKLREADILFYGGARGGGKSDFLIVDFLNGLNEWADQWNGILFRQTLNQLEDIIRRAKEIYGSLGADFRVSDKMFMFPNGGSIKFRYLETDSDVEEYQGHSYTWIGFDELGNYRTDYAFKFMMMCNRSATVPQEWLRMRATGNPGGVGHKWIKARFIDGKDPFKVYAEKVGQDTGGKDIFITSCFVPATVDDNTALMLTNPTYKANLMAQPERIRQAMLEGRWDIKGGGEFFDEFDETLHIMSPRILQGDWRRYYSMDWGGRKPWAVVKLAVDKDGRVIVYGELYGQGIVEGVEKENEGDHKTSVEVAALVARDMAQEGVTEMIADYSIWQNETNIHTVAEAFLDVGIDLIKSVKTSTL
jgi:hypothetical protein